MRVIVEVDGGTAVLHPLDLDRRGALASKLLAAAGDRRREVRTFTGHTGSGFRVPVDIAESAGLLAPAEPAEDTKPVRKSARSKAATKPVEDKPVEP